MPGGSDLAAYAKVSDYRRQALSHRSGNQASFSLESNYVIVLANVDRLKVSSFETDFLRGAIVGENRCRAF